MASIAPYRAYFTILRPLNLVIVGLTQWLLYFYILKLSFVNSSSTLDGLIWLFIIDTIIIAASGYVINDIYDVNIDQLNKPDKAFIPSHIKLKSAWIYYNSLVVLGFCIATYIALSIHNLPFLLIYPIAVGILYLYSSRYKNSIIIGNVLVSLYVAMVPGILLVFAKDEIAQMSIFTQAFIYFGFGCYMIFSFLINLAREIIKDIEDLEGDSLNGLKTLPIVYGINLSKNLISGLLSISALGLCFIGYVINDKTSIHFYSIFGIGSLVIFILISIYNIGKANTKLDFHRGSTFLKSILFMGLIFLFVLIKVYINQ